MKVRSRGAIGALWRRTEAEARSTVELVEDGGGGEARIGWRTEAEHSMEQRRMEAPPRSKLPFIFEAMTCIPRHMPALRYTCSWPGGYRLPFPGYWPVFEYFFWLKSSNSQEESATFPGHFLVHRLITGGLKLQSDCHPMLGNLDRPWGEIHWLIMNYPSVFPDHWLCVKN